MRYIGLDLGTKTLGISLSNGVIATNYKTIRHNEDYDYLVDEVGKIVKEENVDKIVLGFPKNMNGTIGPKGELSMSFKSELEKILSTIKGVGEVKVFINYSESSSSIPLYDESTTTSTTIEGDSSGGTRNTVETESQKEVVFTEKSGTKDPIIQKTTMPLIEGAIITAKGANDAGTKTSIINAVQAATGLGIDRVQVFEMK